MLAQTRRVAGERGVSCDMFASILWRTVWRNYAPTLPCAFARPRGNTMFLLQHGTGGRVEGPLIVPLMYKKFQQPGQPQLQ